jgi:hypothetical protein
VADFDLHSRVYALRVKLRRVEGCSTMGIIAHRQSKRMVRKKYLLRVGEEIKNVNFDIYCSTEWKVLKTGKLSWFAD